VSRVDVGLGIASSNCGRFKWPLGSTSDQERGEQSRQTGRGAAVGAGRASGEGLATHL